MSCKLTSSKILCNYDFDVIALYLNFNDRSLWDVTYAIDHFIQKTKVDFKKVTTVYRYYDWNTCSKYGLHKEMDNINYLQSLGKEQFNFYTDWDSEDYDYINMFNYVHNHKSIAIFYGKMTDIVKSEFGSYMIYQKIPCITIVPNEYCKVFWDGIPDADYEELYEVEYYKLSKY